LKISIPLRMDICSIAFIKTKREELRIKN